LSKPTLAFIGAGNMASALIGGLVAKGFDAKQIWASDPFAESLKKLADATGINAADNNHCAIATADVIVLAIKPQVVKAVAAQLATALVDKTPLIISIAAGINMQSLQTWLGKHLPIVRCMPNTPALVQLGATGLFANQQVTTAQKKLTNDIMDAVGISLWLENEAQIDAVTALSGSGPAYFFLFIEALQAAGLSLGLDAHTANQLTLQTALGAAKMAVSSDVDAAELRRRVTSPGGTTERAIGIFEQGDLRALVSKALAAAAARSVELAQELGD